MSNGVREFKTLFRPATYTDCIDLAPRLRQADKDEVWASNHWLPEECLINSFKVTPECWVGVVNGQVELIFGIAETTMPGVGVPWFLGSDILSDNLSTEFLRRSKAVFEEIGQPYHYFYNVVWSKNTVHIRWLKWLGFEFAEEPIPLGPDQELFYHFWILQRISHV